MVAARARKAARRPDRKKPARRGPQQATPPPSVPTGSPTAIRLLIADDHPLFLDGLEGFFATQPDVTIVARCADGDEALERIKALRPDVALLDRHLPTLDALGIVRRLAPDAQLTARIVMFVSDADHDVMIEALSLGVRGFLNKSLPSRLIAECVRQIQAGGYWLEKQVTALAMQKMVLRESGHRRLLQAGLTPRETEIAKLAAQNLRTGDISKRLNISPGTAKLHLHQIYRKLNLSGRLALMLYARENGLV